MKKIDLYAVEESDRYLDDEKLGEQKSRPLDSGYFLMVNATDARKLLELLERSVNFVADYAISGRDQFNSGLAKKLQDEIIETLNSNTIP
jgi:hypothetical protein